MFFMVSCGSEITLKGRKSNIADIDGNYLKMFVGHPLMKEDKFG